jgi:hypothetical protein
MLPVDVHVALNLLLVISVSIVNAPVRFPNVPRKLPPVSYIRFVVDSPEIYVVGLS